MWAAICGGGFSRDIGVWRLGRWGGYPWKQRLANLHLACRSVDRDVNGDAQPAASVEVPKVFLSVIASSLQVFAKHGSYWRAHTISGISTCVFLFSLCFDPLDKSWQVVHKNASLMHLARPSICTLAFFFAKIHDQNQFLWVTNHFLFRYT